MSFNDNGVEIVIPTIREDGVRMSEEDAIKHYTRTGKHLGKFSDPKDADEFAQNLSKEQGRKYAKKRRLQEER
jgi:hypothetical protein